MKKSGKQDGKQGLMMSLGKDSATEALDNLGVGLDDEGAHPGNANDLQISEIR